ncbi:MAG: gliding motility-associated C-terminal domain-containing protein [Flavobacteriales bacterium]|nr:gliding motility-associated C-terminal domain-containing protein [Flavobacteriales bacterium]
MNGTLLLGQHMQIIADKSIKKLNNNKLRVRKSAVFLAFCLLSTMSFAQLPSDLSGNLKLWVDGSDPAANGSTPGAGTITSWVDKSSQGSDLTSPNVNDPTYIPSDAAFNGKGVLAFGANTTFRNNSFTSWSSDHTLFIVFQQQSTQPAGTGLFSSGDDGGSNAIEDTRFEISLESGGINFVHHTTDGGTAGTPNNSLFGTQAAAISAPTLYSFSRSGNNVTCYTDGIQVSTNVPTTGNTFDEYILNTNREENEYGDTKIAEVIIYDTVLSPAQMTKINNYLACKYGLPIISSTPGGIDPCNVALWMKGDAGTDTTGLNLNSWIDQGKGNFDGTAASGEEPLFNPKDNNYNSSLTFDPGNLDKLDLGEATASDSLMLGSSDFSIYAVASVDTTANGVLFADDLCSAPKAGYYLHYNTTTKSWSFDGSNVAGSNTVTVEAGHSSTDYSLVSVNRSGQTYIINNNEGLADTVTTGAPINYASTTTFTHRWIGASEAACSLDHFDGNVSELVIVKGSLTSTQNRQVRSYLALKYGLTLPSNTTNYLASDGTTAVWNSVPYWHDVAGIGRDDASGLDQRISKSQDKSAIVTIATDNDFANPNTDPSRTSFGADNSYLVWGNNDVPASNGWTTSGAPTGFAILPQEWRVKEVGTVGGVSVQVDVTNTDNDVPSFVDSLFLVRGTSIGTATPVAMTETSPGSGIWRVDGIDFVTNDFFTFAVKNSLIVEFSDATMASADEAAGPATPFPTVIATGVINIPTTVEVEDDPITATVVTDYDYVHDILNIGQDIYNDSNFVLIGMTIVHDLIPETPNELVRYQFVALPSNGVAVGDANASGSPTPNCLYTISDDDSYSVEIEVPAGGNAVEGSSHIMFRVFGGGPNASASDITGTLTLTGSATSAADYTPLSGPVHFTIPIGDDDDTVTVSVLDDLFLELTETVTAEIATISAGVSISGSPATANITDDELAGVQVVVGSPVDAPEGSSVSYTYTLAGGVQNQTGGPVTGPITYGGSAVAADYAAAPPSFSIPHLGTSQTLSVFIVNDQAVEITENLTANINNIDVNGTNYTSVSSASADIFDQDTLGLTLSVSSPVNGVSEGVGNLIYNVTLDGNLVNETGSAITGTVDLSASGATAGADYTDVTNFSILNDSTSGQIIVPIIDDGLIEGNETVVASISNIMPFGSTNPSADSVSVTIFDNDAGGLQISIDSPVNATETPPSLSATVTFDVSIISGTPAASNITGTLNFNGGTAVIGSDFDTTGASTYTILAGDLTTQIVLPVINDGLSEPDETVVASFVGNPSLAGATYVNTTSTATIFDDDAANLTVEIDTISSGTEGSSNVFFVVALEFNDVNGTGGPITGSIALTGTAGTGDYSFTPPLEYSIANGQTSDTVMITVTDDFDVEFTETLTATLLTASVGSVSSFNNSATAFIYDNELPNLSISALSPVDGEEGVGDITFTVSIDGGWVNSLGQPITGDLIYSGTASSGLDFTELVNFSIPDGVDFEEHTLVVANDLIIENLENVTVTLTNPNFGVMSNDSVVTADIIDNDLAAAQLTIASTVDGIEAPTATDAEFVVSIVNGLGSNLENQTGGPITGTISVGGTAQGGGVDYSYSGGTSFSIADSSLSDVLTFSVNDDALEEVTETIIVTITSTSLGGISADSSASANLFDDDTDTDNDGLTDLYDPITGNIDSDCDGIFDGCDADADGDGNIDPGMVDTDGDGINDGCDAFNDITGVLDNGPDINGDGLNDVAWDPTDSDEDLLPDHVDPNDNNPDSDGDGIPDGADADVNNDGVLDNGCDEDLDGIHNIADGNTPGNTDLNGNGIDDDWDVGIEDRNMINYIVSPNGDNINDKLEIKGLQFVNSYDLKIFNRWGALIYESRNYQNDWDGEVTVKGAGTLNGDKVPDGTYFYVLDVIKKDNEAILVRGYIDLRR